MNKDAINKNPVVKLSFEFSLAIISFCEIWEQKKKLVFARQLLNQALQLVQMSFGIKAQHAEGKAEFIHKFKIAAKQGEETQVLAFAL